MTQLLEEAITKIKRLSNDEQDAIAAVLMAELESERKWELAFDSTAEQLSSLADEALAEYRGGLTNARSEHDATTTLDSLFSSRGIPGD